MDNQEEPSIMEKENDKMRYTRSFLGLLIFLAISAEGLSGIWTTNEFLYKPGLGARGEREKPTYDGGLDRVDVRLAKEVWVGDPKNGATLQDALKTLGTTTARLRVPKGTYSLDASLTIPPNITLQPERGAIFAIADTKTLAIHGGLEAGLFQIFSCAGTGKVAISAGAVPTIFPQWWGASPAAGAAVNTAAIQASFIALADYTSWTLPAGPYICNNSIILGDYNNILLGLNLDFRGQLMFDGCSGLDIRGVRYSYLRGINVKRVTRDWATNHFGVKFGKCRRNDVELRLVQNFTYGFYLDGDSAAGDSNAYMTFHLGYLADNKYGQYVTSTGGGWNNEFNYCGGQFTQNNKAGVSGDWAVYFQNPTAGGNRYDNHRWYGPSFENLHNGMYFAGYNGASQMFLSMPRFEEVDNWIEAAPRNLTWIQGALAISRADMPTYCPRLYDSLGKSIVTILGSGYYDLDSYLPYATPKDSGGFTFYNPWDLRQSTNFRNTTKDVFTFQIDENITDFSAATRVSTSYPMNKGFQANAAPVGAGNPMSYAKNAIAWNTNVASGQPMGWVCSKSGSIYRTGTLNGIGSVTGTTLAVTTVGNTYYLFVGAFLKINGVQHQVKANPATNVYTLYANNLGGDVTGAALASDPPTWVAMPNFP